MLIGPGPSGFDFEIDQYRWIGHSRRTIACCEDSEVVRYAHYKFACCHPLPGYLNSGRAGIVHDNRGPRRGESQQEAVQSFDCGRRLSPELQGIRLIVPVGRSPVEGEYGNERRYIDPVPPCVLSRRIQFASCPMVPPQVLGRSNMPIPGLLR